MIEQHPAITTATSIRAVPVHTNFSFFLTRFSFRFSALLEPNVAMTR
jgi:hypothetical protein